MAKKRVVIKSKAINHSKPTQALLVLMGKAGKKKFSERDKLFFKRALRYKNMISHAIKQLLKNSEEYQYLVDDEDQKDYLNYFINKYVRVGFLHQLKIPKETRYTFDKDTPAKILKLRNKSVLKRYKSNYTYYSDDIHQEISKLCCDLHEEKCCVCHDDFITPYGLSNQEKKSDKADDYTMRLRCGHYIHHNCLYQMYLYQDLEEKLRCPMCRDYDEDHFYNKQRISILEKRTTHEWFISRYYSDFI